MLKWTGQNAELIADLNCLRVEKRSYERATDDLKHKLYLSSFKMKQIIADHQREELRRRSASPRNAAQQQQQQQQQQPRPHSRSPSQAPPPLLPPLDATTVSREQPAEGERTRAAAGGEVGDELGDFPLSVGANEGLVESESVYRQWHMRSEEDGKGTPYTRRQAAKKVDRDRLHDRSVHLPSPSPSPLSPPSRQFSVSKTSLRGQLATPMGHSKSLPSLVKGGRGRGGERLSTRAVLSPIERQYQGMVARSDYQSRQLEMQGYRMRHLHEQVRNALDDQPSSSLSRHAAHPHPNAAAVGVGSITSETQGESSLWSDGMGERAAGQPKAAPHKAAIAKSRSGSVGPRDPLHGSTTAVLSHPSQEAPSSQQGQGSSKEEETVYTGGPISPSNIFPALGTRGVDGW